MIVTEEQFRALVAVEGLSYQKAADRLGVSKSAINRAAKKYKEPRVDAPAPSEDTSKVKELERQLSVEKQKVEDLRRGLGRNLAIREVDSHFKIALISDTHYGSLYHDSDALKAFMRYAEDQGVGHALHAGDVLEGERMHFGQERELSHTGLTQQLGAMQDQFPHTSIDVSFISGNHDMCYRKQSGIDIGGAIAHEMSWDHVGDSFGEVKFDTPNGDYRIALLHPGGGTAYAVSYRMQKIIEQWEGGKKPDCLVVGHFHKAMWLPSYRNVSGIHPGCFQKQTPFMASKSLAAHVAGVILDVTVGDGWKSAKAEYVTFY